MAVKYDIFLSHAWADGDRPKQMADALTSAGLRVWIDADEIKDFAGITHSVTENLAQSKALIAYYSKTYPLRRACQWELTAAFLAGQAEGDARRRVLVINPENRDDHIRPLMLRDAKFRVAPKEGVAAPEDLVRSIVNHLATLKGPLAEIRQLTSPVWYGTSPLESTRFVGRMAEMWEVHSRLHATDAVQVADAVVNVAQVTGLGGVGKSLLAEEYALHFGAAYPGGVFWLRAYGNDDAKATLDAEACEAERVGQIQIIAERVGLATQGMTAAQIEGALARHIERQGKPCLWIVDDLPTGLSDEALRRWFAPHPLARTLITTRTREYAPWIKSIDLSVLAPDEAYQLLTAPRAPDCEDEEAQAKLLVEDLGRHALALDVTASAIENSAAAAPFANFRKRLAQPDKDVLELATALSDALPHKSKTSIAQTLLQSIRGLGPEGMDFLRLASTVAVAPIPGSLVTSILEEADNLSHQDAEDYAALGFKQATTASLAEKAGESREARTVHTLVSRTVRFYEKSKIEANNVSVWRRAWGRIRSRFWDVPSRTQSLRTAAIVALTMEAAKAAHDPRLHKQIELHVAHARQLVAEPSTAQEAKLVQLIAHYDFVRGSYTSARTLCERNLAFCRRSLGKEHPDTLLAMNNMTVMLMRAGDVAGSRELLAEALAIRSRMTGHEDPSALGWLVNLPAILDEIGERSQARELKQDVVSTLSSTLGPDHPWTLVAKHNLAKTLHDQGDLAAARRLQEDTLAAQLRVLGPEHTDTLASKHNLAHMLKDEGDLQGARKLTEETLAVRRKIQGPEHPDVLRTMLGLSEILYSQGDNNARKLQEELLANQLRLLGPEHPDTLTSMQVASHIMYDIKDGGARKLQEESLAVRRRLLGPEHPQTLKSMADLAATLLAQRNFDDARNLAEETLEICRRVLGPEHSDTTRSAGYLFLTFLGLREYPAALTVLERDLLWLLKRDPGSLSSAQREIRDYIAKSIGASINAQTNATTMPQSEVKLANRVDKVGRNSPCPCGSGKKYKKCCG